MSSGAGVRGPDGNHRRLAGSIETLTALRSRVVQRMETFFTGRPDLATGCMPFSVILFKRAMLDQAVGTLHLF